MTDKIDHKTHQFQSVDPESPVILLVDDNDLNLQTLYETLDHQGYQLLIARSGEVLTYVTNRSAKI